jgi:hypothetical protein
MWKEISNFQKLTRKFQNFSKNMKNDILNFYRVKKSRVMKNLKKNINSVLKCNSFGINQMTIKYVFCSNKNRSYKTIGDNQKVIKNPGNCSTCDKVDFLSLCNPNNPVVILRSRSSSNSADRGRSIIQVTLWYINWYDWTVLLSSLCC